MVGVNRGYIGIEDKSCRVCMKICPFLETLYIVLIEEKKGVATMKSILPDNV